MTRRSRSGARRLRYAAIAASASLVLLAACSAATGNRRPAHDPAGIDRPNIVFVLTDDLSWNLLPFMPQVRRMQADGLGFSAYFVSNSLCCPSRATILTGRYPHNTRVLTNEPPDGGFEVFHDRGEERATFATALQARGYRTALMGKYFNGYLPGGVRGDGHPYVPPGWSEWDVTDEGYAGFDYTLNETGRLVRYGHRPQDYMTDVLSRKGLDFIDRSVRERRPFLLELSTFAPHHPYIPAPRHAALFRSLPAPRGPAFNEPDIADKPPWLRRHPVLTPRQIQIADYRFRQRARAVQAVDEMIAGIRRRLTELGEARRTYLVFSSDNGYHLGEHRLPEGKMTAFDTDIRVPLIVVGPGVPAGRTVRRLAQNTDLAPTFVELAHAKPLTAVDGRSLAGVLHGGSGQEWRDAAFVEHYRRDFAPSDPDKPPPGPYNPPTYKAIRTDHEVYVEYADGTREYYDLSTDPEELDNAVDRLPAARREQLSRAVAALSACSGAGCAGAADLP